MDMNKIKLVYSQKYNQFYKPMRIDEDVGVVHIIPTKNRHDKSIRKDEILRIEENPDYRFVVMYDANTTAEQNFMDAINSDCSPHIKLNEIRDFNKNMLAEFEHCIEILKKLAASKPKRQDQYEVKIQQEALRRYRKLHMFKNIVVEQNRKSYENQEIPKEIINMALAKRLFIERKDDYCKKSQHSKNYIVASSFAKRAMQSNFPCGFIIKNKGGFIVAGRSGGELYTLSVEDVIEFVKKYDVSKTKSYSVLYQVPISERKKRQLANCYNILSEHGLYYKNEHNYFFWILDKDKNIIAGGKNGFGFKSLHKYCRMLQRQSPK